MIHIKCLELSGPRPTVRTHGGEVHRQSPLLDGVPPEAGGESDGGDQGVNIGSPSSKIVNGEMQRIGTSVTVTENSER